MKKTKLLALILTCAIFLSALMLPVTAAEGDTLSTETDAVYKATSVTVDGTKGEGEYGNTPNMILNNAVWSGTFQDEDATAASYPNLYLSTDGDNLYVFYEVAQSLITADSNTRMYFSFETNASTVNDGWANAAEQGYGGMLEILFGHKDPVANNYGLANYYYKNKTSVDDTTKQGIDVKLGTDSYMKVDGKDTPALTVEIKIPLMPSVKEALAENSITINFGAYQRYNFYVTKPDGSQVNSWCLTGSLGYNSKNATNSATLPQNGDPRPVIAGFQSRTTPDATDSVDVRFVSVMKADADKLANMQAGYDFVYYADSQANGITRSVSCTKAYETLNAGDATLRAADYGGAYFFCYTISGLSYGKSYTFDVACWTKEDSTSTPTESIQTVRVTITVSENGDVSFSY